MVRLVRMGFAGLWTVLPFVWRAILLADRLMTNTFLVMCAGMKQAMDQVPMQLIEEARSRNVPTIYYDNIRRLGKVFTFITILVGWILLAHLTVWLTRFAFRIVF